MNSLEIFSRHFCDADVSGDKNCRLCSHTWWFHENPHPRVHDQLGEESTHNWRSSHVFCSTNESGCHAVYSYGCWFEQLCQLCRSHHHCQFWVCECIACMKLRCQIRYSQWIIDVHFSRSICMCRHVYDTTLLRLL